MTQTTLHDRLEELVRNGVEVIDRRQTFLDDSVRLDRIFAGSILFPGTRLVGEKTLIAPGARIGTEGPATVVDTAVGANAEIASGFVSGAVLLDRSKIGANGHVRSGTLLEEEASTAHAVGLKQTVLMSFVTLGSLINCCDCLISGGRSRSNHTEVGSGFIHFNFTPWGENGDKATPSLMGGVPHGAFLREERIFVGGSSGMVGPNRIGFGSLTVAGQIIRSDVAANRIRSERTREIDAPWDFRVRGLPRERVEKNLEYMGHLAALRGWYSFIRKPRSLGRKDKSYEVLTIDLAIELLENSILERWTRLKQFLGTDAGKLPSLSLPTVSCPLQAAANSSSHLSWVKNLSTDEVGAGIRWLQEIVQTFILANQLQVDPGDRSSAKHKR
jgi:hypothetical protein